MIFVIGNGFFVLYSTSTSLVLIAATVTCVNGYQIYGNPQNGLPSTQLPLAI